MYRYWANFGVCLAVVPAVCMISPVSCPGTGLTSLGAWQLYRLCLWEGGVLPGTGRPQCVPVTTLTRPAGTGSPGAPGRRKNYRTPRSTSSGLRHRVGVQVIIFFRNAYRKRCYLAPRDISSFRDDLAFLKQYVPNEMHSVILPYMHQT